MNYVIHYTLYFFKTEKSAYTGGNKSLHVEFLIFLACYDLFLYVFLQGRHVKTGQLAAIKVMEVTEVKVQYI